MLRVGEVKVLGFIGAQHQDKADFLRYCVMEPVKFGNICPPRNSLTPGLTLEGGSCWFSTNLLA